MPLVSAVVWRALAAVQCVGMATESRIVVRLHAALSRDVLLASEFCVLVSCGGEGTHEGQLFAGTRPRVDQLLGAGTSNVDEQLCRGLCGMGRQTRASARQLRDGG